MKKKKKKKKCETESPPFFTPVPLVLSLFLSVSGLMTGTDPVPELSCFNFKTCTLDKAQ